jgi:hypothetical protein
MYVVAEEIWMFLYFMGRFRNKNDSLRSTSSTPTKASAKWFDFWVPKEFNRRGYIVQNSFLGFYWLAQSLSGHSGSYWMGRPIM